MWLDSGPTIHKQDLMLQKHFVNAPGTLGFVPDTRTMPFLKHFGAFITNPISYQPRHPAGSRAYLSYEGGFLLHTGLPNPGIKRSISRFKRWWANAPLPVIVHLLAEAPGTLSEMVQKLETLENLMALEIGLPPDCDPSLLETLFDAASGELPLIIYMNKEQLPDLLDPLGKLGASAVHLGPPRGTLPNQAGDLATGRLYGPAVFPLMLHALKTLVDSDLKVITYGGINNHWQAQTMFESGAMGVSLGEVLWKVNVGDVFDSSNKTRQPK